MSAQENLQKTLERLARMNSANQKTGSTASKSTMKFFKAKPGKNNLLVLPTPFTEDPFLEWGTHKNLLDVSYKDVACVKHNKGEECVICQVVDDLKKQNWKGNYELWKPLELKIRYYSPVINLDEVEAGIQYWGYGKSVLSQFENWLLNLEDEEKPFYTIAQPEKIVVTYSPDAAPTEMYKLDKKLLSKAYSASQNEEWAEQIKPLKEVMTYEMPQEKVLEALEKYMENRKDEVAATTVEDETPTTETKVSKLEGLKSKK